MVKCTNVFQASLNNWIERQYIDFAKQILPEANIIDFVASFVLFLRVKQTGPFLHVSYKHTCISDFALFL